LSYASLNAAGRIMTKPLANKIALVAGASSGIGEAAAIALAEAGATVAISARRKDRLEELARKIEAAGATSLILPGDVGEEKFAVGMVEETVNKFGRIDILINSAGIIRPSGVESTSPADWRQVFDVNLHGTFYACHAAIPHMRKQGGGDIINISSNAARRAVAVFNSYSATKNALNAFTDAMRQEVGGYGIRVCVIMPGATATEVADSIPDPNVRAAMQQHTHKQGAMESADIAAAILFTLTLPQRANVCEILIRPTVDVTPT
jgi:NADP-dependent 3-hydroxy acid dehydrogenase YdfG